MKGKLLQPYVQQYLSILDHSIHVKQCVSYKVVEHCSSTDAALLEKSVRRYCYRQAELGIGDCGGLRFIPGGPPLMQVLLLLQGCRQSMD
jgi:hypothetical protein